MDKKNKKLKRVRAFNSPKVLLELHGLEVYGCFDDSFNSPKVLLEQTTKQKFVIVVTDFQFS